MTDTPARPGHRFSKIMMRAVVFLLVATAGSAAWLYHEMTSLPEHEPLPLASGLIALPDAEGQILLQDNPYLADYDALQNHFESQIRPAWCGVASSVTVLNAMANDTQFSQRNFFNKNTDTVRHEWQVNMGGMTLDELAALLRAQGVQAIPTHASDTTIDTFRKLAVTNLSTPGDYLLVNYHREALGQGPYGHISPLAAYDEETDRFLILDVTSYHYPPVWVETATLWQALNTIDNSSGKSRGFVEVRTTTGD